MELFDLLNLILFGIVGLAVGSFLNVCIYRIPNKESIITGPSHCTSCGERIKRYDLIPVLSYIILGGKCRHCKARISPRYVIVELLTCLLFVLFAIKYQYSALTVLYSLFCSSLIAVAFIDYATRTIPNSIVLAILIIGIILAILNIDVVWYERLIGFFSVSVLLLILALAVRGGMGGGDIKLMAACGLVLGWKLTVFAFLFGSVLASVFGVISARKSTKGLKSLIPFGPFLSISMVITVFVGNTAISWYLGLF